jgi:hypothetical protein
MSKQTEIPKEYTKERAKIQTGDIILFSDNSPFSWISKIIRKFTKSLYQHNGVALVTEAEGVIFILESTTLGMGYKEGVQINLLSDRLRTLGRKHKCFVRHVKEPLKRAKKRKLWEIRTKYMGTEYESSLIDLFLAGMKWNRKSGGSGDTSIFCSELIAIAFQYVGILDPLRSPDEYTPSDFSTEHHLETLDGTQWGKEIALN